MYKVATANMLIKIKLYILERKINKKAILDFMSGYQNCMLSVHINILALHYEFLDYQVCGLELAEAGGWALGGIISKFKTFKNIGFNTFTKLYHTGVVPINKYASGIWRF